MPLTLGTPPSSRNYLQVRPSTRTVPPADPRMAQAQRWTVWTIRPNPGKKPSKVPVANPTDPSTWNFYHAARVCLSDEKIAGLGFEMYGNPHIIGVDIDNCIGELNQRTPTAAQFLAILEATKTKCHVEISPSGKGLRIFAGETPTPFHDFTNKDTGVEVYTGEAGRFLAFTGHMIPEFAEVGGPFDPLPEEAVAWLGKHASKWKEGKNDGSGEALPEGPPREALPDLSRRDDWEEAYKKIFKKLSKEHKEFIKNGVIGDRYASASEHLFGAMQALLRHAKIGQAYQILISADGSYGVALDHREGKAEKAKTFIWDDLHRAAKSKEKHEEEKAAESAGWRDCDIVVETVEGEGTRAKLLQLNVIRSFERHPEWINRLGFDEFNGVITLDKKEVTAREIAEMSAWVVDFLKWSMEPRRQDFLEALEVAARTRGWNPVVDALTALVWDRRSRMRKLTEALVEDPDPLDYELMRRWVVGYVARGMKPGCQMDTMLCLRGDEGAFKTSFCRAFAMKPEWFGSAPKLGLDQESSILRVGKRVLEVGEGVAVSRAGRHELKDDVTRLWEDYRPKYARSAVRVMRSFVYVLTANLGAFLRSDQDGLRRFWPIDVRDVIDIEWIRENLDQIIAEGVEMYTAGSRWWFDKHRPEDSKWRELLRERVATAVSEDPLDSAVDAVVGDKENRERGYITLNEIKRQVEGIAGLSLNAGQVNHLIEICHKNGMTTGQMRIGGRKIRLWRHPEWAPVEEAQVRALFPGKDEGEGEEGAA